LDTVGHYARPDILKLQIDRSAKSVMEEMASAYQEMEEDLIQRENDSTIAPKKRKA